MPARILSVLLTAALAAPAVRADDEKPKKLAEPGGKPLIIQLDASKLPPELLKELLKHAKPAGEPVKPGAEKPGVKPEKPGVKPGVPEKPAVKPGAEKPAKSIGLADAVAIAEKTTQGTAARAERKGDAFVVDVQTKGGKSSVTVDGSGKVGGDKSTKGDKDGEKGEKKKEGDNKEEGKGEKGKKKDDDDKDEGKGKKGKKDD